MIAEIMVQDKCAVGMAGATKGGRGKATNYSRITRIPETRRSNTHGMSGSSEFGKCLQTGRLQGDLVRLRANEITKSGTVAAGSEVSMSLYF